MTPSGSRASGVPRISVVIGLVAVLVAGGSCRRAAPPTMFELLAPSYTGVSFTNQLPEDTSFNTLNYLYYYNGGGVAVGDVNNDGLPDLYFTSNLGSNHLYLNKGNHQFEDVTVRAGVADSVGWKTGVTMADVNGDGYVDIFVCGVSYLGVHGRNVLYINNGNGTFTDRTTEYGLAFVGYSTQALFFDYDGDGDLDMYLLNHSVHSEHGPGSPASRTTRNPRAGDRLYRNDNGHFVDVSAAAGIYGGAFGYGLGVVASDFDGDGCPDLYVANDFQEDDFLYHNNCDGTFSDIGAKAMRHTSRASMGVDAADFNNDARPDIISADMLPEREDVLKTSAAESFSLSTLMQEAGYHPQFGHNALQLNRGSNAHSPAGMTYFSEIGFLAGVAATDWSWAPLFADLDNDGRKDLFITAGIYRRPIDLDYLAYVANPAIQASLRNGITQENLTLVKRMPQVAVPNHAYRNNGDLSFANVTDGWGLGQPGFSNGAVYVDLDNSGALDLVVNRINEPAAIYRNHAREQNGAHYLRMLLQGEGGNTQGIGAKVLAWHGGAVQLLEQMPTRGFQSSVDPRLHFGFGKASRIDSLLIVWPDRRFQVSRDVPVDRTLILSQHQASGRYDFQQHERTSVLPVFADVTASVGIDWRHRENPPFDYEREPLLPHLMSTQGPAIAVGDVNGDGMDDIYVGGAKWQPGTLFLQQRGGTFRESTQRAFVADSLFEDVDAVFFDANGDGHPDLYVVSGGGEFTDAHDALQDRLYLNDGLGNFHRDTSALPRMHASGSRVAVGDFNGDGHLDLFVGRRAVTGAYGKSPRSYLLENDGKGRFKDVTFERAPALAEPGMVTSAVWIDYDHDGRLDLIVVGEWMPVRVFHQENGHLVDRTKEAGMANTNGWWNDVTVADLSGDGRPSLVLGNLGLNAYLSATPQAPARMYVGNFSHSNTAQAVITVDRHGASYPVADVDQLTRAIPELRQRFPSYTTFGGRRIEDLFSPTELNNARHLEAYDFASSIAVNNGNGTFTLRRLPPEAQFAPLGAAIAEDFDGDGRIDLLLAGNEFGLPPLFGRYDASYGMLMHGEGGGRFTPVELSRSGLVLDGQIRRMKVLRQAGGDRLIIVGRNDDKLEVLRVTPSPSLHAAR